MNNLCLKPPPMDNILPHLYYTNLKTISHNKIVYDKTCGKTFKNFSQKIFILKHVLISNCQYYHLTLVAFIMNYCFKKKVSGIVC